MTKYRNIISFSDCIKRKIKKNYGVRGDYYRDQTAIIHSRPFRRLKNKTQVFFAPKDDHVCTRIEHVMHVATIAATICKGLNEKGKYNLDIDLAFAIGLGHDIGHAPFGHAGEEVLSKKLGVGKQFYHELNGYRIVEYIANQGQGLNLTYAVKDGIISHNGEDFEQEINLDDKVKKLDSIKDKKHYPSTYEGCIVRIADKIAYFGRDIEDALIAKYITKKDIPIKIRHIIGDTNGEIIDFFVNEVLKSSTNGIIKLSNKGYDLMLELRDFNYNRIYNHEEIKKYKEYCEKIIKTIYEHLINIITFNEYKFDLYSDSKIILDKVFGRYLKSMLHFYRKEKRRKQYNNHTMTQQILVDFIGGMTDVFAIDCMREISIPKPIDFFKKN